MHFLKVEFSWEKIRSWFKNYKKNLAFFSILDAEIDENSEQSKV